MKLGFSSAGFSSSTTWFPAYTLESTIGRLAAIGYDGIEILAAAPHAYPPFVDRARRDLIKKCLDDNGLELSSMLPMPGGGPGNNPASVDASERAFAISQYREVIEFCAEWGGRTVIYVAGWYPFGVRRKDAWTLSCSSLAQLASFAQRAGVTIVIEPTPADSNLVESCDDALEMMDEVGQDCVKVMFDTSHVLYRNESVVDYALTMGPNLFHVHLADNDRLPPGRGRGDFVGLASALNELKYDKWLVVEIGFDKTDPNRQARLAFEYLRPLFA